MNPNKSTYSLLFGKNYFADCKIWSDSCCYGCRLRALPLASSLAEQQLVWKYAPAERAWDRMRTTTCEIPGFSALRLEHLMSNSNIRLSNSNPCRLYSSAMTKRGCHVTSLLVTCLCFSSSSLTCDLQPHGALSPTVAESFCTHFPGVIIHVFSWSQKKTHYTSHCISLCSLDETTFQSTWIIATVLCLAPR